MNIENIIKRSIAVKETILADHELISNVESAIHAMINTLTNKGSVFFCGNGGSAADAQHLAAELSGRFYLDREPLYCEALHVNSSYLTAVANDYGYDHVYSRLISAKGSRGDILVGISTSGNSQNIVNALKQAQDQGMITIGMTGAGLGKMSEYCNILMAVPSQDTPRIQEAHIMIGHIICELVEKNLFGDLTNK